MNLNVYRTSDVAAVAQNLLGKMLCTNIDGELCGGLIIETEAYVGVIDKASHAYGGRRTRRTEVMYEEGGIAYVYLCYGIHCLLNVVTGEKDVPHAVLIRAIRPTLGIEAMQRRRNRKNVDRTLAGGPGALTQALGITLAHNGMKLNSETLWIEDAGLKPIRIEATPRVGIDYAEEWVSVPYRFLAEI